MSITRRQFVVGLTLTGAGSGAALAQLRPLAGLSRREWSVDGVTREALIRFPQVTDGKPQSVVFAFHGHGGGMRQAAFSFGYHRLWPEAIVIYPQGLNTPGRLTDPEGKKPGWQSDQGDQGDRDLKFFDAILGSLRKETKVDDNRIYSTGHSNGGGFSYLLWAARGEQLAAVAPSAAAAFRALPKLKPKPVMHVAGKADDLVKFEWQQTMIDRIRKINGCGEGTPWAEVGTQYASPGGTPVVTYIHDGTHKFPREAPAMIVRFFKEHTLRK